MLRAFLIKRWKIILPIVLALVYVLHVTYLQLRLETAEEKMRSATLLYQENLNAHTAFKMQKDKEEKIIADLRRDEIAMFGRFNAIRKEVIHEQDEPVPSGLRRTIERLHGAAGQAAD